MNLDDLLDKFNWNGHIMVRCPDHQMITHDMEEEDVYDNP